MNWLTNYHIHVNDRKGRIGKMVGMTLGCVTFLYQRRRRLGAPNASR
jgi:hypothetical protein